MIVITQLFTSTARNSFLRTILNFKHPRIQYYILVPHKTENEQRTSFKKMLSYHQIVKSNPYIKLIYYKDIQETVKYLDMAHAIIHTEKANRSFFTLLDSLHIKYHKKMMIYVEHGLFIFDRYYGTLRKWSPIFHYYTIDPLRYKILKKIQPQGIKLVNSMPQLDYMLKIKKKLKKMKAHVLQELGLQTTEKTLLFVNMKAIELGKFLKLVLMIKKVLPSYKIILRDKSKYTDIQDGSIFHANANRLIYDYFFSNIILVYGTSTVYTEGLLMNRNTLLYQGDHQNEDCLIHNNKLFISKSYKELKKHMALVKKGHTKKAYYKKAIEEFLKKKIHYPLKPCSKIILKDILHYVDNNM